MRPPFTVLEFQQRSAEWYAARLGRLTGSRASDMLASVKSGEAAGRRDLRVQLVCERLTATEQGPDFTTPWMERGMARESEALAAYEAQTGNLVSHTGFLRRDDLMAGCSPDGYLGDYEVIVEAKVPKAAIHLEYLRRGKEIPPKYVAQLRHNLWTTGAECGHFISYGPDFPASLRVHVVEVRRDDLEIAAYEDAALAFLEEVDRELVAVREMAGLAAVAA